MNTNLNNIRQKCSWRNSQQNCMQQLWDLFTERRYFQFQNEIQFFQCKNDNKWTIWNIAMFCGCNISCFYKVLHHIISSLLMSWHNIIFTFFSYLFKLMGTWLVTEYRRRFHVNLGFSDNDRRRCWSVAQTSALLHGNEKPSLRTFALSLPLELV